MGFRLRRSARLGPLRFHFTAAGLSSISLGGRGASLNLPVSRRGGPRASLGLPGTGLSWSVESPAAAGPHHPAGPRQDDGIVARAAAGDSPRAPARPGDAAPQPAMAAPEAGTQQPHNPACASLPNSRRLRPSQLQVLRRHCRQLFEQQLYRAGSEPWRLWEESLVSRLLGDPAIGGRLAGLLALIETPQALTAYLERARSQDDLKRRCQRCLQATETALRLCGQRGWLG